MRRGCRLAGRKSPYLNMDMLTRQALRGDVGRWDKSLLRYASCFGLLLFTVASALSVYPSPRRVPFATAAKPHLDQPDLICRNCHQEIYDRYQQTPMAKGSGLAVDGLNATQLAAKDLVHRPSGVTYRVFLRDGQPYLSYSRPATDPKGPLEGEHRLDFFIGSGHRGRTYLYQEGGLWFEAPINWYSKATQWDMAPAFGDSKRMPDPLPVDPNCLHCHVGDAQPSIGAARNRYAAQPFNAAGIGCSACHGDPSAHLATTHGDAPRTRNTFSEGKSLPPASNPASSIINPSRLDPTRRDAVCLQCHLEGDVAVNLPGKSLQMYRPGDDLTASVAYFVDTNRSGGGLRATSQYEGLLRSACKRASGDRLTCTTCHDPHSSPAPEERVAFFRSRCLSCHTGQQMASQHHPEEQDCAVCHMPTRKTIDISHEQSTDHEIVAKPRRQAQSVSTWGRQGFADLAPIGGAKVGEREFGLAYAELAERGDQQSGQRALSILERLARSGVSDPEVLDQLGFLLQVSGSDKAATENYLAALHRNPSDLTAAANLAILYARSGRSDEAIVLLKQVTASDPSRTSAGLNLAFIECRQARKKEAIELLNDMLRYNPDSMLVRRFLETGRYGDQSCSLQ